MNLQRIRQIGFSRHEQRTRIQEGTMQEQEKRQRFEEAWKTIFEVEEVSDDDNFFELGGDSMNGISLLTALAERGLKLDMLKIYTCPTVGEMIEELEEMDPVSIPESIINGTATSAELEQYLNDPAVLKAMEDFGITKEEILQKAEEAALAKEKELPKEQNSQPQPIPVRPSGMPDQPGYFVPLQMMLFIPANPADGTFPLPPSGAGAVPVTLMATPYYPPNWPQSTASDPGNEDKNE